MDVTANQLKRVTKDWSSIAGEPVSVEQSGSFLFAYGTELAVLRLSAAFKECKDATHKFSSNLNSWYFSKELMC